MLRLHLAGSAAPFPFRPEIVRMVVAAEMVAVSKNRGSLVSPLVFRFYLNLVVCFPGGYPVRLTFDLADKLKCIYFINVVD